MEDEKRYSEGFTNLYNTSVSQLGLSDSIDKFYDYFKNNSRNVYDYYVKNKGLTDSYEQFMSYVDIGNNQSPQAPSRVDVSDVEGGGTLPTVRMTDGELSAAPSRKRDDASYDYTDDDYSQETVAARRQRRDELQNELSKINRAAASPQLGFMAIDDLGRKQGLQDELRQLDEYFGRYNTSDDMKDRIADSEKIAEGLRKRDGLKKNSGRFWRLIGSTLYSAENANQFAGGQGQNPIEFTEDDANNMAADAIITDAEKKTKLAKDRLNAEGRLSNEFGFTRGFKNTDWKSLSSAVTLNEYGAVLSLMQKMGRGGELTDSENNLLDALRYRAMIDDTFVDEMWERIGMNATEQLKFTAEFVLTGYAGARTIGGKAGEKALNGLSKSFVKNALKKETAKKAVAKGVELGTIPLMQTLYTTPDVIAGTMDRMAGDFGYNESTGQFEFYGGEGFGEALAKSFGSSYKENLTEAIGDYLIVPFKGVNYWMRKWFKGYDRFVQDAGRALDRIKSGKLAEAFSFSDEFVKATGMNGVFGEYAEEFVGNIIDAAFIGDMTFRKYKRDENGDFVLDGNGDRVKNENWMFDGKQNLETFLSCAVMTMTMGLPSGIANQSAKSSGRRQAQSLLNQYAAAAENEGLDTEAIDDAFGEDGGIEGITDALLKECTRDGVTDQQRMTLTNYTLAKLRLSAMRNADTRAVEAMNAQIAEQARRSVNGSTTDRDGNGGHVILANVEVNGQLLQNVAIVRGNVRTRIKPTLDGRDVMEYDAGRSDNVLYVKVPGQEKPVAVWKDAVREVVSSTPIEQYIKEQQDMATGAILATLGEQYDGKLPLEQLAAECAVVRKMDTERGTVSGAFEKGVKYNAVIDGKITRLEYVGGTDTDSGRINSFRTDDGDALSMTDREAREAFLDYRVTLARESGTVDAQAEEELEISRQEGEAENLTRPMSRQQQVYVITNGQVGDDGKGNYTADSNPRAVALQVLSQCGFDKEMARQSLQKTIDALAVNAVAEAENEVGGADASTSLRENIAGNADARIVSAAEVVAMYRKAVDALDAVDAFFNDLRGMEIGDTFSLYDADGNETAAVYNGLDEEGEVSYTVMNAGGIPVFMSATLDELYRNRLDHANREAERIFNEENNEKIIENGTGQQQGTETEQKGTGKEIENENGGGNAQGDEATAGVLNFLTAEDHDKEMEVYGNRSILTDYKDGVAIYTDENGEPAILLAAVGDDSYVGLFRVDGNRWSSKMENATGDKNVFRGLISAVMNQLPEGAELIERSSVSADGIRVIANQLKHGFAKTGEFYECGINGADVANVLGEKYKDDGSFKDIYANQESLTVIRQALKPFMESLGLTENDIFIKGNHEKGKVIVRLPVIAKVKSDVQSDNGTTPVAEENSREPIPVGRGSFGNIYNNFRGKAKEAVEFLIKKKSGEATGALSHRSVGEIDIVWGDEGTGKSDGFGLAKLVKYHPEVVWKLQELLDEMEVVSRTANRVNLESKTHKAGVRLDWDGERKTWLMTMFEKKGASEPADGTTDITGNQSGSGNDTAPSQNPDVSGGKDNTKTNTEEGNPEKNSIPFDKDGNIDHSALDPEDAETYSAAVNAEADNAADFAAMGDEDYVRRNMEAAAKAVEKAGKMKPKSTGAAQLKKELADINAKKAAAKRLAEFWDAVGKEAGRRASARLAEEMASEEKAGTKAGVVGQNVKDRWDGSQKIEGSRASRTLADGTVIKGRFMLVPANAMTPSHDYTKGYATSEGFPLNENGSNINDRDYRNDRNAQVMTEGIARDYDGQAVSQVPVVSPDGVVYDGNGRTIAGQMAAANNTDAKYTQALVENAAMFGFSADDVMSVPDARVVFVTDEVLPYTTETFAKFNRNDKKTQSNTEKAIAKSKTLNGRQVSAIASIMDEYETLDSLFSSEVASAKLMKVLQETGVIGSNEVAEMIENGRLNATGREYVENVVIGSVFNEETIRRIGANQSLRRSVLRAIMPIIENSRLGEYSLAEEINNAISLVYEAKEQKKSVILHLRQGDAFNGFPTDRYSEMEQELAMSMDDSVGAFRDMLGIYNRKAADVIEKGGADMFDGVLTKNDVINEVLTFIKSKKNGDKGTTTDTNRADEGRGTEEKDSGREEDAPAPGVQGDGNGQEVKADSNIEELRQSVIDLLGGGKQSDYDEAPQEIKDKVDAIRSRIAELQKAEDDAWRAAHPESELKEQIKAAGEELASASELHQAELDLGIDNADTAKRLNDASNNLTALSDLYRRYYNQHSVFVGRQVKQENIDRIKSELLAQTGTVKQAAENEKKHEPSEKVKKILKRIDEKTDSIDYKSDMSSEVQRTTDEKIDVVESTWSDDNLQGDVLVNGEDVNVGIVCLLSDDIKDKPIYTLYWMPKQLIDGNDFKEGYWQTVDDLAEKYNKEHGTNIQMWGDSGMLFENKDNDTRSQDLIDFARWANEQIKAEAESETIHPAAKEERLLTDDEAKAARDKLASTQPIPVDTGVIKAANGKSARAMADKWADENLSEPVRFDTEAGTVVLDKRSISDSLAHGYSQAKLDAITSLRDGFAGATYIGSSKDASRPDTADHYFAYPILHDSELKYVFCRAKEDVNKNRLYVHEVFVADKIKNNTLQTAAELNSSKPHGGVAFYRNILSRIVSGGKDTHISDTEDKKKTDIEGKSQREQKAGEGVAEASKAQKAMVEALVGHLNGIGVEATTDVEEGQRILDMANGRAQTMSAEEADQPKQHKAGAPSPVFYSNAFRAVEGIKQEKAPASQWLAMLEKNGGLKAGEDKWLGLRAWLGEQAVDALAGKRDKNITKDEILDYIAKNDIRIEEVKYAQFPEGGVDIEEEVLNLWKHATGNNYDKADQVEMALEEKYGADVRNAITVWYDGGVRVKNQDVYDKIFGGEEKTSNSTRLNYTTEGLKNKKEIALTVPTIEPYKESDEVHFGDAGEGRAVAWVRFGETTDVDGKRVLVIDEIQSKRHQDGREYGYESQSARKQFEKLNKVIRNKIRNGEDVTDEEYEKLEELGKLANEDRSFDKNFVPDAPFDKNWHELAMKRMLRYAAENGYDKVAWTTGAQQAERYNMAQYVNHILSERKDADSKYIDIVLKDAEAIHLVVNNDGKVLGEVNNSNRVVTSKYNDQNLTEIVGKEMANRLLTEDGEINEKDMMIGGEGMKGFYDKMLPNFVDKYGKKWGAKTADVTLDLPNEADRVMHSVDVTPEMKESVMEGQPMFFKTEDGEVYGFVMDGKMYIDPRIATSETPIHEYTHLWAAALRKANPKAWERLKKLMDRERDLTDYVKHKYPELAGNEDALMDEVFAHYSGKRGKERLDAEMKAEMDNAKDVFETAKVSAIFGKIKAALDMFWNMARDLFAGSVKGLNKMKAEDFADMAMNDLLNKFNPKNNNGIPAAGQKTLVGMHNISEEKLRKALKLGGYANPSVAVVDTRKGVHTDYGEITLIPASAMIDKQRGRNAGTWLADAWTPTYPQVSKMPGKGTEKALKQILKEWAGNESDEAIRNALKKNLDYFVYGYTRGGSEHLQYQFLKEKGMQPEIFEKNNGYDRDFYAFLKDLSEETGVPITELAFSEHGDRVAEYIGRENGERFVKSLNEELAKKGKPVLTKEKERQYITEHIDEWKNKIGVVDSEVYDTYKKAQRPEAETDVEKTFSEAGFTVSKSSELRKEYEKWLADLDERLGMEEKLFAGFTPSGKRRYLANTLENVSMLMNKGGQAGNTGWTGAGPFIAKIAEQANTLDKIRRNKGKLIGNDQGFLHEEAKQHIYDEFYELSQVLNEGYGVWDSVGEARMEEIAGMKGDIRRYLKREYGVEVSDEWMQRYNDLVYFIRKEYPVYYFETKFNRPVELWEFRHAIVPYGTGEDVVEGLKRAGVQVAFYDRAVEGDRERVTMEVANSNPGVVFHRVAETIQQAQTEAETEQKQVSDEEITSDYAAAEAVINQLKSIGITVHEISEEEADGSIGDGKDTTTRLKEEAKSYINNVGYNPRNLIPKVRGGWTEKKILKYLKEYNSLYGNNTGARLIAEFDNIDELRDHMYWHGSPRQQSKLAPSIVKSEKWAERYGGGGYGSRYWAISITKNKKTATNFSGIGRDVVVHPIILAKNAVVKDMTDTIGDSAELEDYIVQLYEEGVDAVWIGGGEQELCVINPRAIVNIDSSQSFDTFGMWKRYTNGELDNPTDEQLESILSIARHYAENPVREKGKPSKPSRFVSIEGEETMEFKPKEQYDKEIEEYNRKLDEYYKSDEYREYVRQKKELREGIKFHRTSDGIVYGYAKGGEIYLNRERLNPDTPIHEYTHLWDAACRQANPELWRRGVELMKQTSEWAKVLADPNYSDIRDDDDKVASEVHSRLAGREGARVLGQMQREAEEAGTAIDMVEKMSLLDRVKTWVNDFWKWVKDTLTPWTMEEAAKVSVEDFVKMPIGDLFRGVNPNEYMDKSKEQLDNEDDTRYQIIQAQNEIDGVQELFDKTLGITREVVKDENNLDTVKTKGGLKHLSRAAYTTIMDGMHTIKAAQDAIAEKRGRKIADNENAYMSENVRSSVGREINDRQKRQYIEPMIKAFANMLVRLDGRTLFGRNIGRTELEDYMIAKHGIERNEYMYRREVEEYERKRDAEYDKYVLETTKANNERLKGGGDNLITIKTKEEFFKEKDNRSYSDYLAWMRRNRPDEIPMERDAYLESKRPQRRDVSGLTELAAKYGLDTDDFNGSAQRIVDEVESMAGGQSVDVMWKKVKNATDAILANELRYGMISKDVYDSLKARFMYYVPLRGWQKDMSDVMHDYSQHKKDFAYAMKKMEGRRSIAFSPLSFIETMLQTSVVAGEKNRVLQKLYNLGAATPNDLIKVGKVWYMKTTDGNGNEVVQIMTPDINDGMTQEQINAELTAFEERMSALEASSGGDVWSEENKAAAMLPIMPMNESDHVMQVMINGQRYCIITADPSIKRCFDERDSHIRAFMPKADEIWTNVTRGMSKIMTTYNPEFFVRNTTRDIFTSLIGSWIEGGRAYQKALGRNIRHFAAHDLRKLIRYGRCGNSLYDQYWNEFLTNGGETGFTRVLSSEKNSADIDRMLDNLAKGREIDSETWVRYLGSTMEGLNRWGEDLCRFAAYVTNRERGKSVMDSTAAAKRITVNFNTKGKSGFARFMCSHFSFFNATVQGLNRVMQLAGNNTGRFLAATAGLMFSGILFPIANLMLISAFGDDEDELAYMFMSDYISNHNLVIFNPFGGGFITIPYPQEFAPVMAIGNIVVRHLLGWDNDSTMAADIARGFLETLPIDLSSSEGDFLKTVVTNLTPTAFRPIMDCLVNQNFMGRQVYTSTPYNQEKPSWTKAPSNTLGFLVAASRWANSNDPVMKRNGEFFDNVLNNPAVYQHLFEGYTGGIGRFINNVYKFGESVMNGDADFSYMPVVRSLYLTSDIRKYGAGIKSEYYKMVQNTERANTNYKAYDNKKVLENKKGLFTGFTEAADRQKMIGSSADYKMYERLHGGAGDENFKQIKELNNAYDFYKANGLKKDMEEVESDRVSRMLEEVMAYHGLQVVEQGKDKGLYKWIQEITK